MTPVEEALLHLTAAMRAEMDMIPESETLRKINARRAIDSVTHFVTSFRVIVVNPEPVPRGR